MRALSLFSAAMFAGVALAWPGKKKECRALVLSGGGSNGAWEAGVIYGMINNGNKKDFEWDVLSGVSAGSINTMIVSGYPIGQEEQMATYLSDTWNGLKNSDVWVDWPMGKVAGLTVKAGALDNSPGLAYMRNIVKGFSKIERAFVISTTNVDNGDYIQYTDKIISLSELPDAVISSASIPLIFPPY